MEPVTFICDLAGLTIVRNHSVTERNKFGEVTGYTAADVCQFVNGKYTAHTEEEIEFMRNYCMKHPATVQERTRDDEDFDRQRAEYMARKAGRRPGKQGPVSAQLVQEDPARPRMPSKAPASGPSASGGDPLIDIGE